MIIPIIFKYIFVNLPILVIKNRIPYVIKNTTKMYNGQCGPIIIFGLPCISPKNAYVFPNLLKKIMTFFNVYWQ